MKKILLIQGHPDSSTPHFCHALAASYAQGATHQGHAVRTLDITRLDFPLLRSQQDWETQAAPAALTLPID